MKVMVVALELATVERWRSVGDDGRRRFAKLRRIKLMVVALKLATEEIPRRRRWREIGTANGGMTTGNQS
ncbi:hypothetical protein Ddye_010832 [Dipteronia dyeriana]|uniref:Uncharacterized protein n=1 Tax=Dipteronia dyeriana TaxID=168575 RepID=A0AAD9XDY0_9ROSI|nr:hypothetical protein Ddye_010832 [Dipteronia dyeriana]